MRALLRHVDFGRLILAVLIALALYSAVRAEQNPPETGTFDVPVDMVGVPPGMLILNTQIPSVRLTVSAPREEWVSLRPSSFRAIVQLNRATPGVDEYPVTVEVPDPRIRVAEVLPPRIPVRLDENIERSVPVRLTRTGNVPFGYEVGDAQIDPSTITVTGPSSVVRRVEAATAEVRLDGATVDVDGRYAVTPVDSQGQTVTTEARSMQRIPEVVRVRIPITQQLSYKTVGVQPDIGGAAQSGFVIEGVTTEPATVTLVGAPRALAAVNFVTTERIDVSEATAPIARQAAVVVPEGLSAVQQDTVRVTVRISPIVLTQSFTTVPLPENVGPGLQITSALPSVQVIVRGPASALQSLRPTDLRPTLNLAGLGPGIQRATVEVNAPAGVTVQGVNPQIVSVTLADTTPPTPTAIPPTATPIPVAEPIGASAPQ